MTPAGGEGRKRNIKGTGSKVDLRKDGRYRQRRTINGREYTGYGKSPTLAVRDLNDKVARASKTRTLKRGTEPRVVEVFDEFYKAMVSLRGPRTLQTYRLARTRLMPLLGKFRVSQLTKRMVREVYAGLTHLGVVSRKQSNSVFSAAVTWAINDGILLADSPNPFEGLGLAAAPASGALNVLNRTQLQTLFVALIGSHWALLFMFLAVTGCRIGEALGLSWDQCFLDEANPYVRFCQAACWHDILKRWFIAPRLKNQPSLRTVYLPLWLAEAMRQSREEQAKQRAAGLDFRDPVLEKPDPDDDSKLVELRPKRNLRLVFVTPKERGIVSGRFVHHPLEKSLAKAGLPRMRVHDLRHSCATNLLAAGETIDRVSERLGHGSIVITHKTYKAYIVEEHQRMGMAQEPWGGGWNETEAAAPRALANWE